jgi:hypothetical protein
MGGAADTWLMESRLTNSESVEQSDREIAHGLSHCPHVVGNGASLHHVLVHLLLHLNAKLLYSLYGVDLLPILAMFPKSRQEAECIFLLGTFIQLVDKETVLKQKELLVNTVIGVCTEAICATSPYSSSLMLRCPAQYEQGLGGWEMGLG